MSTYPNLKEARCFSTAEHRNCPRVLVTEFDNVLVEIRPFPQIRPSGNFIMCRNGDKCTRLPNCTYAHSRAEKREWNRQLKNEPDTNLVCVYINIILSNEVYILPQVDLRLSGFYHRIH